MSEFMSPKKLNGRSPEELNSRSSPTSVMSPPRTPPPRTPTIVDEAKYEIYESIPEDLQLFIILVTQEYGADIPGINHLIQNNSGVISINQKVLPLINDFVGTKVDVQKVYSNGTYGSPHYNTDNSLTVGGGPKPRKTKTPSNTPMTKQDFIDDKRRTFTQNLIGKFFYYLLILAGLWVACGWIEEGADYQLGRNSNPFQPRTYIIDRIEEPLGFVGPDLRRLENIKQQIGDLASDLRGNVPSDKGVLQIVNVFSNPNNKVYHEKIRDLIVCLHKYMRILKTVLTKRNPKIPLLTGEKSIDVGSLPVVFTLEDIRKFLQHNELGPNIINDLWTELTGKKYNRENFLLNLDSKHFINTKIDDEGNQYYSCDNVDEHADQDLCFPRSMNQPTLNDPHGVASVNDKRANQDDRTMPIEDIFIFQDLKIDIKGYLEATTEDKRSILKKAWKDYAKINHPDKLLDKSDAKMAHINASIERIINELDTQEGGKKLKRKSRKHVKKATKSKAKKMKSKSLKIKKSKRTQRK